MSQIEKHRIDNDCLQTPVVELQRPDNRARATLISLFHGGPAAYYQAVSTIIEKRQQAGNAIVVAEVGSPVDETTLSEADSALMALWRQYQEAKRDFALFEKAYPGFQRQRDVFPPRPDWRTPGYSELEVARSLGIPLLGKLLYRAGGLETVAVLCPPEEVRRIAIGLLDPPRLDGASSSQDQATKIHQKFRHKRLHATLTEIWQENPGQNVVLPWGGNHIPPLATEFRELHGYETRSVEWITVSPLTPQAS